ncbi:dermonecrotic toxin domain-containing protein [Pseudomonas sp. CC120222-01a]|uniref:dermonecrotic toxin domain-containing protein n=1 Tax=Pseudomonas sp. CC120222-01a TaxID=1378075 RepID=UPI0013052DFA|nr:DUF6543 domain-containing protein [Pseudomonas sp. CC120222-01a]
MRDAAGRRDLPFEQACQAEPEIARQLVQQYGTHRQAEDRLHALLASLPALEPFAAGLLTEAISQRFGQHLDVSATYLLNVSKAATYKEVMDGDPLVSSDRAVKLATQSLLHWALQNFEAFEAEAGGLEAGGNRSLVLDSNKVSIISSSIKQLPIVAEEFAAMVRELDIGGQYQKLIDSLLTSTPAAGDQAAPEVFSHAELSTFRLHVQRAYLQGAIDKASHDALLQLAVDGKATYQGRPILCSRLSLLRATLTGAAVLGVAAPGFSGGGRFTPPTFPYGGWLVIYLPGMPEPLTAHASRADAEAFLLAQMPALRRPEHLRLVPEREKSAFLASLRDTLEPYTWNPAKGFKERMADPNARITLHVQPFTQPFVDELVTQRLQRLRDDGLFHAVPTASKDQDSLDRTRAYFESVVLGSLNIGAFFIPGLAPLMLGLTVLQLGHEVYEGLASWSDGEREQAFAYLMDVVENAALIAALGATGAADAQPAVQRIAVESPSFIEELDTVELADGSQRLWRPDLQPFAHDVVLPADSRPDALGLHHHQGKTWLAIEDRAYSVRHLADASEYRLQPVHADNGYQPAVQQNGAGAWLLPAENPALWPQLKLFRRCGHLSSRFDDQTATRILSICGIEEDVLRRAVSDNLRLPALLEDTMARFELDRALDQWPGDRHAEFQVRYDHLPASEWPQARVIAQRYPGLPTPVVDELLRNASLEEWRALSQATVPVRMAEEIRVYQQQIRLSRTYEGLYLEGPRNWDSDRLVLHSLEHLPGWQADTGITLARQLSPFQVDTVGSTPDAPGKTIFSLQAGYLVSHVDTAVADGPVLPSMFAALFEVLSPAQRAALGVESAADLRGLIQRTPLLPRATTRKLLGMQPVRPGYRSPMRLADGRLGYPLGGSRARTGSVSRHNLLARIRQLGQAAPQPRPAEQILTALENQQLTRAHIDDLLQDLSSQHRQLQRQLTDWRDLATLLHRQTPDELQRLMDAISQHWYDRAFLPPNETPPPLRLERLSLLDFPLNLPERFTASVTDLQLVDSEPQAFAGWSQHAPQLTSLLRQFGHLRSLQVSRSYLANAHPSPFQFSLPVIAQHLPQLESLGLINQNLSVSSTDIDSLAGLEHLRRLDLSGNRLSEQYTPNFDELTLDFLGLDRVALDHWPDGLGRNSMAQIRHLSLRDNHITLLPDFLLEGRISLAEHAHIDLQGNAILDQHLLRILLSEQARATCFQLDQPAELRQYLAEQLQLRRQLHEFVDNYVNASGSTSTPSQAVLTSRTRIATALNEFWQHQEMGNTHAPLRLTGVALEHMPSRLPSFFSERVGNLTLEAVSGVTAQLDSMLAQFPNVTRLTIDGYTNAQASLPSALLRLPRLTDLALRNIGLQIDEQLLAGLARLHGLQSLDLGGNRLAEIAHAPGELRSLRRLDLNDMNLSQWPAWVNDLLPLDMLDLSDNQLSELPEFVLSNLESGFPITSIQLFNNPISDQTYLRARTSSDSQHSFTFAMDVPDHLTDSSDDGLPFGHFHIPLLDPAGDRPNLNDWLLGSDVENEAMRSCWKQLEEEGNAANLLALVGRLRQSGPYSNVSTRVAFSQRVRQVLVKAAVDSVDRAVLNLQASEALLQESGDLTCHDGALLVFQDIELFIANQRLEVAQEETENNRYLELRRLFRLHALDEVAKSEAGARDVAEVQLTYRRELNATLQLGLPDDNLRYAVNTSLDELIYAEQEVQRGELGEAFLDFAAGNERWVAQLRLTHAARFAQIEEDYQAQVLALPEQYPDTPLEQLSPQFEALERSRRTRERRLVRELTSFANPERKPRSSSQ